MVHGGWEGREHLQCVEQLVPFLESEGFTVKILASIDIYQNADSMCDLSLIILGWTMDTVRPLEHGPRHHYLQRWARPVDQGDSDAGRVEAALGINANFCSSLRHGAADLNAPEVRTIMQRGTL